MLIPSTNSIGVSPLQVAASTVIAAGCTCDMVKSALPDAFRTYDDAVAQGDAALARKAGEKLYAELNKLAASMSAVQYSDLAATLDSFRAVSPLWHQLTDTEKKAADLTKQAYKALFRGSDAMPLNSVEANVFFEFVLDVIVASQRGVLTSKTVLGRSTPDDHRSLGAYLDETTGTLTTHDAKSAYSSAQMRLVCDSREEASQYLNSGAFPVLLSSRASGGPLRNASWLENVYRCRVALAGSTFMVLDAICSERARAHFAAHGVTALNDVPLVVPQSGGYHGHLVGQTTVKTGAGSVALNLVPSNAMLAVTAKLAERVADKAAHALASIYREQVLQSVPAELRDAVASEFAMDAFVPAARESYDEDKLIKALNAFLKPLKGPALTRDVLKAVWKLPEPNRLRRGRQLHRVPIVGSNPQNCGGAYQTYAGDKGIYRFPAAVAVRRELTSRDVRSFHVAQRLFSQAVSAAQARQSDVLSLEEKYQTGSKWLPRRVQRQLLSGHVSAAASAFVGVVRKFAAGFNLSDDDRTLLDAPGLAPIQRFLLQGAASTDDVLGALAREGLALIKSGDSDAQSLFIETVVARLRGRA